MSPFSEEDWRELDRRQAAPRQNWWLRHEGKICLTILALVVALLAWVWFG